MKLRTLTAGARTGETPDFRKLCFITWAYGGYFKCSGKVLSSFVAKPLHQSLIRCEAQLSKEICCFKLLYKYTKVTAIVF